MNTRQLKYVLALTQEGSFSRAAETLGISQPSLSQYIKKIEEQIGLPLFDRTNGEVRLTDAGKVFIENGKKIIDLEHQMESQFADLSGHRSGSLVIGTAPYRAACMLPVIAKRFQAIHPGMHLIVREGTTTELAEGMAHGDYDLCLTMLPIDERVFAWQKIMEEELLLAVPVTHPPIKTKRMAGRKYPAIDVRCLNGRQLVKLTETQYMQRLLDNLAMDYELSFGTAAVVKSLEAQLSMVRSGVGLALLPSGIERFCGKNEVRFCSFIQDLPRRQVVVMWRKECRLSSVAEELKSVICDIVWCSPVALCHNNHYHIGCIFPFWDILYACSRKPCSTGLPKQEPNMWNYTQKVMDHFLNPRNVGEIKDADAVAEVGNITCGDALKLYLKLDEDGRIKDAKFQTFGCASAIASSSALTELIKGKTLDEAAKITNQDIVAVLGTLPQEKMHCSVMGMEAMQAAIADYRRRHGIASDAAESDDDHEGRVVCKCFGVTEQKIRRVALANNLHKAEQITDYTKAGGACGRCLDEIQTILDDLWRGQTAASSTEAQPSIPQERYDELSPVRKVLLLNEVIGREIRPALAKDGGGVELVDLDGDVAIVRLTGHCSHCARAGATLKGFVESRLQALVSPKITVKEA